MKSGRAQRWSTYHFRWESKNLGHSKYIDWDDFVDEFKAEFTLAHADTSAINRLETSMYYQKNRTLDDYMDEFQDLIAYSRYTDPKTIVVKFCRGLDPQIQNVVATMAFGRPSDSSPREWYKMACVVDQNRSVNEAFSSARQTVVPPARPVAAHLCDPPVPKEIPQKLLVASTPLCFHCKQPGDYGKDCPTRFDVQHLTVDELQEILGLRIAKLDVAPPNLPRIQQSEPKEEEDFHQDSE